MSAEQPSENGGRSESRPPHSDQTLVEAAPGMARLAVTAWWRTAAWMAGTSARAGSRLARAAVSGESAVELVQDSSAELRRHARRFLGLRESADGKRPRDGAGQDLESSLRARGAELLRRSADVHYDEDLHPAYAHILDELTPDEGRILRLLALRGPRAAVDVRGGLPLASELVEQGLSMIGQEAGCRHTDRVLPYLNNLNRLGLVWFSRETINDLGAYQVIEAQPEAVEALRTAGRFGRTVRRSVRLTPFGKDFCDLCLPLDSPEFRTAEFEAIREDPRP